MASATFKGVFPILVTPFDDHGNLDFEFFQQVAEGISIRSLYYAHQHSLNLSEL